MSDSTRIFQTSYTPHAPIFISGNQDFIDQGWPGNGTESNPFTIEGLNITSPQVPIEIRYVDVHFIIRDCFLQPTALNYTIDLFHADNGTLEECEIYSEYRGIKVEYSDHLTISGFNIMVMDWAAASIQHSNDVNITGCDFFESQATTFPMRVDLSYCEDSIVKNCFFDTAVLQVGWSPNMTVIDNIFVNGGITLNVHILYEPTFDYTITGNSANGKPILYLEDAINMTVNADDYAQVILMQCENIIVQNGTIENVSYGVQILYSDFCSVEDLVSQGTAQGIIVHYSNNTQISRCIVHVGHGFGIALYYSHDCTVQNNTVFGDASGGSKLIYLASCYDSVVQRNHLSGVTFTGIEVSGYDCLVLENTITSCYCGIRLSGSRLLIVDNRIVDTSDDYVQPSNSMGILAAPIWNSRIVHNEIIDGDDWGILYLGNNSEILSNNIAYNLGVGLEIYAGSTNNTICFNVFGWNHGGNAIDNGFLNQWDNGMNTGNLWSDYDYESGYHPYTIPGSAGSQDRWPDADVYSPNISHPDNVYFDISVTVVNVTWSVWDVFPAQYWLYHNGELIRQGTWRNGFLTFAINVINGPSHNVTLVVSDLNGHTSSDTVMLRLVGTSGQDNPYELGLLVLAVGFGAVVALALVVIAIRKKKS